MLPYQPTRRAALRIGGAGLLSLPQLLAAVTSPQHGHVRACAWYSTTSTTTGGNSTV